MKLSKALLLVLADYEKPLTVYMNGWIN